MLIGYTCNKLPYGYNYSSNLSLIWWYNVATLGPVLQVHDWAIAIANMTAGSALASFILVLKGTKKVCKNSNVNMAIYYIANCAIIIIITI